MKLFLATISFAITISIACTASRSAGTQAIPGNTPAPEQSPAPETNSTGQEKPTCQLTLAGAPDIKGLRLGMTPDEVLALFPGSKEDAEVRSGLASPPNELGVSNFIIKPVKYESKDKFEGVNQIVFTLLDGRVSTFSVGYNGPQWPHVDKFVEKFIEGTNLPSLNQWEPYVGMDNQLKILKCKEFQLNVFAGGKGGNLNYALITDLVAEKKLKEREEKLTGQATP